MTTPDTITISSYTFSVPRPYAAGHVCSQAEAEVLNRKLHENLRLNFGKRIAQENFGPTENGYAPAKLQSEFDSYASTYTFGGPDPALAEASIVALDVVKRAIKARGGNVSDYSKAQLADQASAILAGPHGPDIRNMARERVTALQAAAKKELERLEREAG